MSTIDPGWGFLPRHRDISGVIRQLGRVSVLIPPVGDVVSMAELHAHLRIDATTDDTWLESCLQAAVNEIDAPHGWLGRSLLTRTLLLTLDRLPDQYIYLPGPPVTAISSVTYRDRTNTWQTIATTDYDMDLVAEPALVWPIKMWPINVWPPDMIGGRDCMKVQYTAGYSAAAAWIASTGYALNAQVEANLQIYVCTTGGTSASSGTGPAGTGTGIADGTAVWSYVGPAIPRVIRQWLLMRVSELYRDREPSALGTNVNRLSHADNMLTPWRVRA